MSGTASHDPLDRYARQWRYAPLGREGQERLQQSRVLICGCGALGSVIANTLARAGVGYLRIVDRDFLELNNLQRQVLFDEQDVAARLPKAIAAAKKIQQINSTVQIDPMVVDIDHRNILDLADSMDLILDGTDNFETRMLLNDAALRLSKPWIFGGCIGAEGQTMTIIPGQTACLRCVLRQPPQPGETPTCDTAGILGGIVNVVASIQAVEAIKILSGHTEQIQPGLMVIDLWDNRIRQVGTGAIRASADCPACHGGESLWLEGQRGSQSAILCGRNAVQLRSLDDKELDLEQLAEKLKERGEVVLNKFLVRFTVEGFEFTLFPDGRAIVGGTDDIAEARAAFARFVGA
ncbi:MAG: thiamine biosynthesis protein ThiF [Planctomycetaceae bacterium TMED10]|nr:MAG: thiamine biosynthesis protein ThiF [Planctomycetaceae bacterium TMED10]